MTPTNSLPKYVVEIGEVSDPLIVGGKGASLSRMLELQLNVPPGLTITTDAWRAWKTGQMTLDDLYAQHVKPMLRQLFPQIGTVQSVSVRSGAAISMPGMMETLLWVGDFSERNYLKYLFSLAKAQGHTEAELDRIIDDRLLKDRTFFIERLKNRHGLIHELEQLLEIPDGLVATDRIDYHFLTAIRTVFESWDSAKAVEYRKARGLSDELGTACTIQRMISADHGMAGVMLTRGEIEWLTRQQGDVVVDGRYHTRNREDLKGYYSWIYKELVDIGRRLERAYHDAMDIEFTYDGEELWILQCRPVKRTPTEGMQLAVQLYKDGLVSPDYVLAVPLVDDSTLRVEALDDAQPIANGTPINGKLLTGVARFKPGRYTKRSIAIREITTTSDIGLMLKCGAVISVQGGPTCHAALVARELGTTALVGTGGLFREENGLYNDGRYIIKDGDIITILPDGRIYQGKIKLTTKSIPGMWSKKLKNLQTKLKREIKMGRLDRYVAAIDQPPAPEPEPPAIETPKDVAVKLDATPLWSSEVPHIPTSYPIYQQEAYAEIPF